MLKSTWQKKSKKKYLKLSYTCIEMLRVNMSELLLRNLFSSCYFYSLWRWYLNYSGFSDCNSVDLWIRLPLLRSSVSRFDSGHRDLGAWINNLQVSNIQSIRNDEKFLIDSLVQWLPVVPSDPNSCWSSFRT